LRNPFVDISKHSESKRSNDLRNSNKLYKMINWRDQNNLHCRRRCLSVRNKYSITARLLAADFGLLLDVGGRNGILRDYLTNNRFRYHSADLKPGHDFVIDLEKNLPISNLMFDVTVALDVLEHIENIHNALDELLRITRKVTIIALPNMASYYHRFSFFFKGRLATNKYDLLPNHQGDRHRWLTTSAQMDNLIIEIAKKNRFEILCIVDEVEGGRVARIFFWTILHILPSLRTVFTCRSLYRLRRMN